MPFNLPNHVQAVARFSRENADPVMNTFFFQMNPGTDEDDIVSRLDAFYFAPNGPGGSLLVTSLSRAITGLTYYFRAASAPRGEPGLEVVSPGFVRPGQPARMPPDAAICASYRGGPPYTGRRRGRIYIGPLSQVTLDETTGLIKTDTRATIASACAGLASTSVANPVKWVIASRTGNTSAEVVEGYVDEHFDTQRRRDPGSEFFGRRPSTWQSAAA